MGLFVSSDPVRGSGASAATGLVRRVNSCRPVDAHQIEPDRRGEDRDRRRQSREIDEEPFAHCVPPFWRPRSGGGPTGRSRRAHDSLTRTGAWAKENRGARGKIPRHVEEGARRSGQDAVPAAEGSEGDREPEPRRGQGARGEDAEREADAPREPERADRRRVPLEALDVHRHRRARRPEPVDHARGRPQVGRGAGRLHRGAGHGRDRRLHRERPRVPHRRRGSTSRPRTRTSPRCSSSSTSIRTTSTTSRS